jgi:anaerobic magnesium-protoporphyrin IX monomethyl ester cyclase
VRFSIAQPIVGSRLYDMCKSKGYLVRDIQDYSTKGNISTPEFSAEHIEEQAYLMNIDANFIHNYNMKNGNYKKAATYFRHVLSHYPDHAIAHYCLAKAIVKMDKEWGNIASKFEMEFI